MQVTLGNNVITVETERVLWPEIAIATRSGTPALIKGNFLAASFVPSER